MTVNNPRDATLHDYEASEFSTWTYSVLAPDPQKKWPFLTRSQRNAVGDRTGSTNLLTRVGCMGLVIFRPTSSRTNILLCRPLGVIEALFTGDTLGLEFGRCFILATTSSWQPLPGYSIRRARRPVRVELIRGIITGSSRTRV